MGKTRQGQEAFKGLPNALHIKDKQPVVVDDVVVAEKAKAKKHRKIDVSKLLIDEPRTALEISRLLETNQRTITAFLWMNRTKPDAKNKKTMLLYRMLKHLPQEVIDFFMDDNNFDTIYCKLEKYAMANNVAWRGRKPYKHLEGKTDYTEQKKAFKEKKNEYKE